MKKFTLPLSLWIGCFFIAFLTSSVQAQNDAESKLHFYKKFLGSIGQAEKIEIDLTRTGDVLEGHFYFLNKEEKGFLTGSITSKGTFTLQEHEGVNKETGESIIVGTLSGTLTESASSSVIEGTWVDSKTSNSKPFKLNETYGSENSRIVMNTLSKSEGKSTVTMVYAEMEDPNHKKAAKKVNEFIQSHLLNFQHPSLGLKTFEKKEAFLSDFITRYKEYASKVKDEEPAIWENMHSVVIDYNNHNVLAFEMHENIFEGTDRPHYKLLFANFDLKTGKQIELSSLFIKDYSIKLLDVAEHIFREKYGFRDIKNFKDEGFSFKDDKFALNSNYSISKGGLIFFFNEGEIAPVAAGTFEIFIPYSKIKDIISSESALTDILKSYY